MQYEPNETEINESCLTAYVLDELESDEREAFEEQLTADETLRAEVEAMRGTVETLQNAFAAEPSETLSSDQRQAIENALADDPPAPLLWSRRNMWVGIVTTAVAASLVMAFYMPGLIGDEQSPLGEHFAANDGTVLDKTVAEVEEFTYVIGGDASVDEFKLLQNSASSVRRDGLSKKESNVLKDQLGAERPNESKQSPVNRPRTSRPPAAPSSRGRGAGYASAPATESTSGGLPGGGGGSGGFGGGGGGNGIDDPQVPARYKEAVEEYLAEVKNADLDDGFDTEDFDYIKENDFTSPSGRDDSTFSIDVDTASYSIVRRDLNSGRLPQKDAVRIEELVNYFNYNYVAPLSESEHPFSSNVEIAACPWNEKHRLVRIGLKGREIDVKNRVGTNIVFLLDVSGSMNTYDKLPLLKQSMKMLVDNLTADDKVAIVVYAGAAGMVLPSTYCNNKLEILDAIDRFSAGGSTNGGAGIQLAYKVAADNFIEGGVNRVIWATDGDLNVGVTADGSLVRMIEEKRTTGVFLSTLGFGSGNLKNSKMEKITNAGNGNYAYIDSIDEAKKVLIDQFGGTLFTIAKDVKIQIDFNPRLVGKYRLIGYENRIMQAQDFRNDAKDAGEIGAGHTVTALYEIIPADAEELFAKADNDEKEATGDAEGVGGGGGAGFGGGGGGGAGDAMDVEDDPTFVKPAELNDDAEIQKYMLKLKLRYKETDGDEGIEFSSFIEDEGAHWTDVSPDFRFAAGVASFGMILRDSQHKGESNFDLIRRLTSHEDQAEESSYRKEFKRLVDLAENLSNGE